MKTRERIFQIQDIDCEICVEIISRKDILSCIDEYIDNFPYSWFDPCDEAFSILYKDGTYDYIDQNYDGHKIRKQNIASMVYTNTCTDCVYGNFEINEYGVVTPAFEEKISDTNIIEIR